METESPVLQVTAEIVPLRMDTDGVIRIGDTRVTLDTVISAFLEGATAEEIVTLSPNPSPSPSGRGRGVLPAATG